MGVHTYTALNLYFHFSDFIIIICFPFLLSFFKKEEVIIVIIIIIFHFIFLLSMTLTYSTWDRYKQHNTEITTLGMCPHEARQA